MRIAGTGADQSGVRSIGRAAGSSIGSATTRPAGSVSLRTGTDWAGTSCGIARGARSVSVAASASVRATWSGAQGGAATTALRGDGAAMTSSTATTRRTKGSGARKRGAHRSWRPTGLVGDSSAIGCEVTREAIGGETCGETCWETCWETCGATCGATRHFPLFARPSTWAAITLVRCCGRSSAGRRRSASASSCPNDDSTARSAGFPSPPPGIDSTGIVSAEIDASDSNATGAVSAGAS